MPEIKETARVIKFDGQVLPDLNPALPVEDVIRMHAATTPALATAVVEGPVIEDGARVYSVHKRTGNKG